MKAIYRAQIFLFAFSFLASGSAYSSLSNADISKLIKRQVEHQTEYLKEGSEKIHRKYTPLPKALFRALSQFAQTNVGAKVFKNLAQERSKLRFIQVNLETDPDMAVAFRVGFEDSGANTIHYTLKLEEWKRLTLAGKSEKPGEEISSASLGSLIAHELGHTDIGMRSLGLGTTSHHEGEMLAVHLFENRFRKHFGMPLRLTYYKPFDVLKYLSKHHFNRSSQKQ